MTAVHATPRFAAPGVAILLAAACPHPPPHLGEFVRTSRPGAGTIVGITTPPGSDPRVHEVGFAALEVWEAQLSEWREGSIPRRAMAGERPVLNAESQRLFALAADLHQRSGGAFDICWRGGAAQVDGGALVAEPGTQIDLGGMLKGFLADRAGEALLEAGANDFVVDVGGDVLAQGSAGPPGTGWLVEVAVGGLHEGLVLHDEALSSSSSEQQPGHIRDARTGQEASGLAGVYTRAPTGLLADAVATAVYAHGGAFPLPEGACAWMVRADGGVETTCGAADSQHAWDDAAR